MKATVYDPQTGKALGKHRLLNEVAAYGGLQDFRVGSYLGQPVLRSDTYPASANLTRERWQTLRLWARTTGHPLKVSTTRAEARALLAGGMVPSTVGTYRLPTGVNRYAVLSGHGSVR